MADYPMIDSDAVGWIGQEEMIEVDRTMIEDFGIGSATSTWQASRCLGRVRRR